MIGYHYHLWTNKRAAISHNLHFVSDVIHLLKQEAQ